MGRRLMSVAELVRGPDQGSGPDMSTTWLIVVAKTEGATPGLRILDGRGEAEPTVVGVDRADPANPANPATR